METELFEVTLHTHKRKREWSSGEVAHPLWLPRLPCACGRASVGREGKEREGMGRTEDVAAGYAVCTKPAFSISRATIMMTAIMTMMPAHETRHLPQAGSCLAPFYTL